jgi:hypothetical protein
VVVGVREREQAQHEFVPGSFALVGRRDATQADDPPLGLDLTLRSRKRPIDRGAET